MDQVTESSTPLPPHKNNLVQKKQIATGALIALALVALLLLNSNRATAPTPPSPSEEVVQIATTTPERPTTLSALIAQNVAQECTFTTTSHGTELFGTVYVANGMMRTDIQTRTAQGPLQKSSMIHDGAFLYVWGDQMEQGIKMAVPDTTASTDTVPANTAQTPIDLNQEVTYDCAPSSPPSSVFVVPTTIMFVDMQDMMKGIPSAPAAKNTDQDSSNTLTDACAACAQLTGEQQLQCRQALKCATQ